MLGAYFKYIEAWWLLHEIPQERIYETHKESYLLKKECGDQELMKWEGVIVWDTHFVQTSHLWFNHIKGSWTNPNTLREVLEESAKKPDALIAEFLF